MTFLRICWDNFSVHHCVLRSCCFLWNNDLEWPDSVHSSQDYEKFVHNCESVEVSKEDGYLNMPPEWHSQLSWDGREYCSLLKSLIHQITQFICALDMHSLSTTFAPVGVDQSIKNLPEHWPLDGSRHSADNAFGNNSDEPTEKWVNMGNFRQDANRVVQSNIQQTMTIIVNRTSQHLSKLVVQNSDTSADTVIQYKTSPQIGVSTNDNNDWRSENEVVRQQV